MSKFKVGDRVQRKPEYRKSGVWAWGDSALVVEYVQEDGWLALQNSVGEWHPRRFELVVQPLARDELYMRLRTEAWLSHQHATEFLTECPSYEDIRHALDRCATFGAVMGTLVVWAGKNESVYREAARRCGWGS